MIEFVALSLSDCFWFSERMFRKNIKNVVENHFILMVKL
jgi:hypothetical protein